MKESFFKKFVLKAAIGVGVFIGTLFLVSLGSIEAQESVQIKSETDKTETFFEIKLDPEQIRPIYFDAKNEISIPENELKTEYVSQVKTTDYKFNALGSFWSQNVPDSTEAKVKARVKDKIGWTTWYEVEVSDTSEGKDGSDDKKTFSELLFTKDATAYQYKIELTRENKNSTPKIYNINFNYIDSTDESLENGTASASPTIRSRASWGCPEPNSSPGWSPQHQSVSHAIVHHTAGSWNTSDPASSVRAIWSYHTYTRGWGDIGYNYLIDGHGNIYQGRYGGDNVVAGHAYPYNRGSIGIAVMGEYSNNNISSAARSSISHLIAQQFGKRGLSPLASARIDAAKTVGGEKIKDAWGRSYMYITRIIGHRNASPTACPGNAFYNWLPTLRNSVNNLYPSYTYNFSVQNFSITPGNPSIGQEVTISLALKNETSFNRTLDAVVAAGRYNEPAYNNRDVLLSSQVTFAPGETKTFTRNVSYNEIGKYRVFISFRAGSSWINPRPINGAASSITFNTTLPLVKVSSSVNLNPSNLTVGQDTTVTTTFKNLDSRPAKLVAGVAVRINGSPRDFQWKSINIPAGGSYSFQDTKTFSEKGDYTAFTSSYWPDGKWRALEPENSSILNRINFNVGGSPADLRQTSSLNLSRKDPVIGENLTSKFSVKNFGEQTYNGVIGIGVRYEPDTIFGYEDYPWRQVSIKGGATYTFEVSKPFPNRGNYRAFIRQYKDEQWSNITKTNDSLSSVENFFNYSQPEDPKLTSSLSITPQNPVVGSEVTATFKVKNFGDRPVAFNALGVAVRYNEPAWNPRDFQWKKVTINGGQEYTYTAKQTLAELGNYRAFVSSYYNGRWQAVPISTGIVASANFQSLSVSESVKVSSFNISNTKPAIGEEVDFNIKITNVSNSNITVDALGVAVRYNEPAWNPRDFGYQKITLSAGEEKEINLKRSFNEIGKYRTWIAYVINGKWYSPKMLDGQSATKYYETQIPQVRASGINISPQEPTTKSSTTASVTFRNYSSSPAVVTVGVAARYEPTKGFYPRDFQWKRVTIPANGTYEYTSERTFTERGNYRAFTSSYWPDGKWRAILNENQTANNKDFSVAAQPDPKLTSSLSITPQNPVVGSEVTATFKVKNFGDKAITFDALGVGLRLGSSNRDFQWKKVTINGGQEYTYTAKKTLTETGSYRAFVSSYYNGAWNPNVPVSANSSIARSVEFSIGGGLTILDGISIPATYGRTAQEQHLYLNAEEAALGRTQESANLHYQNSLVDSLFPGVSSIKNGMAGGYGAFGSYANYNLPVEDERYYVNMRWNYTEWYEAPDGTCTSTTDGKLDTCTRNTNSSKKAWHYRKRILVINPANGKKLIASVLEAGPAIWTGRVSGLSPEGMYVLGAKTNDNLYYYWHTNQSAPVGLLN